MTALEEIKKALEGVTPGPWSVHERSSYFGIFSQSVARGLVKEGRLVATFAKPHDYARTNARYIAAVNPTAISELLSTLESLQRENEELRQRLDIGPCGEDAIDVAESAADHLRHRAEAAETEVKRLRDRYECWMPVTETPPAGMHPDALLHFYCISDEVDGEESPEYWMTDTWQDKPADAVYWCAIVSPLGPHERTFIARTTLASTGGEHHAE